MKVTYLVHKLCLAVLVVSTANLFAFGQVLPLNSLSDSKVDAKTVVRFFYLPPNDYLHPALFFRVINVNDRRIRTAPISSRTGRTSYISLDEMHALIMRLDKLNLAWKENHKQEPPEKVAFAETSGNLDIKIYFSKGTDQAFADSKNLCATLASLDSAIKQPRALWEFQLFRFDYHCEVAGFNRDAYPEHDIGK